MIVPRVNSQNPRNSGAARSAVRLRALAGSLHATAIGSHSSRKIMPELWATGEYPGAARVVQAVGVSDG